MRKEILLALLILTLITVACTTAPTPSTTCPEPYKEIGSTCCLDNNNNNQCDDTEKLKEKACETDSNCEIDACLGCINTDWAKANPSLPECARFGTNEYDCKCVNKACTEVKKVVMTKITAGNTIRFGEEKLPMSLEMQKDTKILYVTETEDEVYTLDKLQESQITLFYGKDRFIIKKGTNQKIGSLEFVFSGVNPPKSGNYAIVKVDKPSA